MLNYKKMGKGLEETILLGGNTEGPNMPIFLSLLDMSFSAQFLGTSFSVPG